MASLSIRDLRKSFNEVDIINGVNLQIEDREFVVFVGPSGCGKSTLLRLIAGLEDVSDGRILLGDQDITDLKPAKRDLAMVFQSYALYPHMTVRKNMSFALKLAGLAKAEMDAKVNEAARILELEPLLERKPKALSGGQRQRVAIGRAIVRNPQVFLFDEPLSNLDAALRVQMRLELAKLHQELDATMIYVTHDQVEAMTLADKVVVLNKGNIEQVGSPLELYHHPANLFVAGFMGTPKMSFFPAVVQQCDEQAATVELEAGVRLIVGGVKKGLKPGEKVRVGVRPEHIQVVDKGDASLTGVLEVSEHLGSDTYCHLELGNGQHITVRTSGDFCGEHGDIVHLAIDTSRCHLFDEQGKSAR